MRVPTTAPAMKHRIASTLLLLSALTLTSCRLAECMTGNGEVEKRGLEIQPFHGIVVEGSMDVQLTKADVQQVTVEGQANLIDKLNKEVRDGLWHIGIDDCYRTNKPFVVHIAIPTVDRVIVEGSGEVKGSEPFSVDDLVVEVRGSGAVNMNIDAGKINAVVQGSGDIVLGGTCTSVSGTVQGSGDLDLRRLKATDAVMTVAGSGDIRVQASGSLKAMVQGSGDILYSGSPASIDRTVQGSGDVRPE